MPSLPIRALTRDLVADLRPVRHPARVLYAGAAVLLLSALVHVPVLAADGWAWSGAVSFRKPLTFALSFGLLLAAVGWVLDRLPDRRRLATPVAWATVLSSIAEVGLVSVQAWRGRASHFNTLAAGDEAIFIWMAVMVGITSLCLVVVFVWALVEPPRDRLARTAVTGGLLLVLTALGIGSWIIQLGMEYVDANLTVPQTVLSGDQGVAKFPHGVALHGIQLFILAAVLLGRGTLAEPARRRVLRRIVWSYAAVLVLACVQTVMGLAPLAPSVWNVGVALSLLVIVTGAVRIGRALYGTAAGPAGALAGHRPARLG